MNGVRERVVAEQPIGGVGVGQVDALETESRAPGKPRRTRFLQRDVVVGVEVVDAEHRHAGIEELFGRVHADETGAAGDEHGPLRRRSSRVAHHDCGSTARVRATSRIS